MAPIPVTHLHGPLQELLKELTGVNLPIWTAAGGWTIKWLPEWPPPLSCSVCLPQTLSTFHPLHLSPLCFLLFILTTFCLHCYFSPPYLIPSLFCTFPVFLSPLPPSAAPTVCFCPSRLLRPACLLSVSVKPEEKEASKTKKSNCLPASNSPRHPLQPLLTSRSEEGERWRMQGGCRWWRK